MTSLRVDTKEQALSIPGPAGRLQALLKESPINSKVRRRFGVICHPHPLHGGTMHNKVVTTIARAWQELGLSTLRFNFRGVEESEGQYAEGIGELQDLLAVLHWTHKTYPESDFWLGGFSFGATVAAKAAAELSQSQTLSIQALLTVAPAITHFPIEAQHLPHLPWFIIQGEQDEIVAYSAVLAWFQSLHARYPNIQLLTLPDSSHFFHGRIVELKQTILKSMAPLTNP